MTSIAQPAATRLRVGLGELEALAVLRWVAALGALLVIATTVADPDLWGHVRFGEDILDAGSVPVHDPYSFTSDRPWVNHEWLAEVLMGLAYRAGGAAGIVVLKTALVVAALLLVSTALRRVAWRAVDHDVLLGLSLLAILARIHFMRPQVFSILLFAALLAILIAADRGERRPLVALPLVLLAWANLHGGWLVGLATVALWVLVRLARRGPDAIARPRLVLLWVACAAATLVNPYGTGLWTFLGDTVGFSRDGIDDWLPLLSLPLPLILAALAVTAAAVLAIVKAGRGADPAYVLIVAALGVATLRVGRIDAFYGLAVVMLLGPYLGRARAAAAAGGATATAARGAAPGVALWRRPLAIAIVGGVAIMLGTAGASRATCIPATNAPEAGAAAFLARHAPHARVLTYFDWGEYAIWQLGPGLRVSIDGRRETAYSDALYAAHARLYRDEPGAIALVARIHADLVWLPAGLPVVARLRRAGFKAVFAGPISVILARRGAVAAPPPRRAAAQARCFPEA